MTENRSRIRFNPATQEIEIEGSEEFVNTYYLKITALMSGKTKEEPQPAVIFPGKGIKEIAKEKIVEREPSKPTMFDAVLGFIRESQQGITTSELMEKTGLSQRQIWSITAHASKLGKIKKGKRGVYQVAD